jgi:hypothetical protein
MQRRSLAWAVVALPLLAACAGRNADRTGDEAYGEPAATAAADAAQPAPAATMAPPDMPATPAPTTPPPTEPSGVPDTEEQSPTPTPAPAASEADVPRIPVAEARALYDSGEAVFVDVRDMASYGVGHIKGAQPIPLFQVASRAHELPSDKRIITYCS